MISAERLRRGIYHRLYAYFVRPVFRLAQRAQRSRRIARYLKSTSMPALILGAGTQARPGWLASDLEPAGWQTIAIDATRRLPFDDASLAYVFSEHMIEHITYPLAQGLVREIHRVLRPGGILRVATPDLVRIARLASEPLDAEAQAYVDWNNNLFGAHVGNRASFVVNRNMRWWGHQFLYDYPTLAELLMLGGFSKVEKRIVGESEIPALRDLEHHGDVVSDFANRYETMVVEATKSAN